MYYETNNKYITNFLIPSLNIAANLNTGNYKNGFNNTLDLIVNINAEDELLQNDPTYRKNLRKFRYYGNIASNAAAARNSNEAKRAIEEAVLPVGSSQIKRNADFSISLNAYVGGFWGQAHYKEADLTQVTKKSVQTFGVTAPIGISINKGRLWSEKSPSSLGIALEIVRLR